MSSHRGTDEVGAGAANRGRPAAVEADGTVVGSGAGAGGGGAPEDIDSDAAGGSARDAMPGVNGRPNTGADASNHGSR